MWQIYGEKETCGTKGGLVSGWKQSMKSVSNNEWQEVSRRHSTIVVANIMLNKLDKELECRRLHDFLQKQEKCTENLGKYSPIHIKKTISKSES